MDSLSTVTAADLSKAKATLNEDQYLTLESILSTLPEHIVKKSLYWDIDALSLSENIAKIKLLHANLTNNIFQEEIIFHLLSNDSHFDQFKQLFHNVINSHKALLEDANTASLEHTFRLFNNMYRHLVSSPDAIKYEQSYFYLKSNIFILGFDDALSELIKRKERFDTLTFNFHFDYPLLTHPIVIKQRKNNEIKSKKLTSNNIVFQK